MKRMNLITALTLLGVLVLVACTSSASAATEWTMGISAEMAADTPITADLTYGVNNSATDGYDDGVDENAPMADPSGFDAYFDEPGVGYEGKLKVDMKSVGTPKNWTLMVFAPKSKTVNVSWTSGDILSNVEVQMQELDLGTNEPVGSAIDMKAQDLITITGGPYSPTIERYLITATTSAAEEPPELISCVIAPTPPVVQGTNITVDCLFSEKVTYEIRIENATGDLVEGLGSGTATNPNKKWWNTTTETMAGIYTVNVTMDNSTSGMSSYNNTNTIEVTPAGGDSTSPTVTANTPTGTSVPVSAVINVTFDEEMNETSAEDAFSIIPSVAGLVSWDGCVMTFTPDDNLAYETTYNVTIGTGAEDLAGNNLAAEFSWEFTTESDADTTPPTVDDNTPTGTSVPVSAVINVTFDEEMNETSAEDAFSIIPSVAGLVSWDGCVMTFTPDDNLAYETTYNVTIGTGAEDLAGNNLAAEFSWEFTTESAPPVATSEWTMGISAEMAADTPITADLTYGVNNSATDGYDDGVDENAPMADPSGFDAYFDEPGVGYEGKLKVDMKSVGTPKNWTLMVFAPKSKTVNVSWTLGDILSNVEVQMQELDLGTNEPVGSAIDMKAQDLITITGGPYSPTIERYLITATTSGVEDTAPNVTTNTPTGTSVPVSAVINVTFDEAMNETSAEDAFSIVPSVAGLFSWDGCVMTFTPDDNLAYETTYNVTIGTGAEDLAGNPLAEELSWEFTTESDADTTPPTVTANTPTGTSVPVSAVINVTFDEAMNETSAEDAFSIVPSVAGLFSWDGCVMTFTPEDNLSYETTYNVTIGTGAEDMAGNNLAEDFTWNFTTTSEADTTPPSTTGYDPASGATGVSIDTNITVHVLDAGTGVNISTIVMTVGGVTVTPAITGTSAEYTIVYTPSADFGYDQLVNVTIDAADLNDIPNAMTDTYSFTTAGAPTYGVTISQPADQTTIEGVNAIYLLTVKNTGNTADTYTLSCDNINSASTVALDKATMTLAAGASGVVALDVTNTAAGTFNVTVNATSQTDSDANCTTDYIMTTVLETTEVNVTAKTDFTATSGDANVTGNFSDPLDGWIDVTGIGNDLTASPDVVNKSTLRAGLGSRDVFVSGVYIDANQSNIESELKAENGTIRIELRYTDAEIAALGITDENTLDIYKFNTTTYMWELVRTQTYCNDSGRDTGANYTWVEVTRLCTLAQVGTKPAPAGNGGGGGGDGTYPPGWDDDAPASTPAATTAPTDAAPEPTEAPTDGAPTEAPTDEVSTEAPTTEMKTKGTPGFGAVVTVFAIAGLLVATYLVMRRRE